MRKVFENQQKQLYISKNQFDECRYFDKVKRTQT